MSTRTDIELNGLAMALESAHKRRAGGMASFMWDFIPILLLLLNFICGAAAATNMMGAFYPAIFVFGDSLSDTGNAAISGVSTAFRTTQLPYGETFPGWPTGRFSDGHTLVDLLATHLDLPLLNPFLNSRADFGGGVNYAVGSATALNTSFLNSLSIYPETEFSLEVQLSWHLAYKATVESSTGSLAGSPAMAAFDEGLYIIEIGGNDYVYAYRSEYPPSFVKSTLIPLVMQKIRKVVETLLITGARNFLFVSITPLGCAPAQLVRYDGIKDNDGCLEEYNGASYLHGAHLQREVASLRASYPSATFLFMDYYGAYDHVLKHREMFGFVKSLEACCGAGDNYSYNYSPLDECNVESASVCSDPSTYMIWDGIHFTDSFNLQIFNQTFLAGSYLHIATTTTALHGLLSS